MSADEGTTASAMDSGAQEAVSGVPDEGAATKIQAVFRGRRDRRRVAGLRQPPPPPPSAPPSKPSEGDDGASAGPKAVAQPGAGIPRPPSHVSLPSAPSQRSLPPGVRRASKSGPKLGVKLKRVPTDLVIKAQPLGPSDDETAAAATKIQAVLRGKAARRRVAALQPPPPPPRDADAEAASAVKIQAVFRGRVARRRVAGMAPPPPPPPPQSDDVDEDELAASAAKIQAVFRGRQVRKRPPPPPTHVRKPQQPQQPPVAASDIPRPGDAPKSVPRPPSKPANVPLPAPPRVQPQPPGDDALRRELAGYKARVAALEGEHRGKMESMEAGYKAKVASLEAKLASLSSQVSSYRKQLAQHTRVNRQIETLTQENKRLQNKLDNANEDVQRRIEDVKLAESQVEQANVEIRLLEQQIQKEVDDFETLRDTLQAREDTIGQAVAKEYNLQQDLKIARMEQQRLKDMVKVRDARIEELTPEMVDGWCDARPLDDSRAVQLRDDALLVKDKQIADLSHQNLKLMASLDQVETEVQRMQEDMATQDRELQVKKKEALDYKKDTIRLTNIIKSSKGQEYAMDVAAKQNTQLLQLLEAAEKKVDEANESKEEAWAQVADMRAKMLDAIRDAAQHEAVAITEGRDARQMARQAALFKTRLDKTSAELSKDLREVKEEARIQVESVQTELQLRREKQYSTLHKLGQTEELLRAQTQRGDEAIANARALQQRVLELEAASLQQRSWRQQEAEEAKAAKARLEAQIKSLKERLARAEADRKDTKAQMMEMGQTVVELAERQRVSEDRSSAAEERTRAKDGEIAALKERVAQMLDAAMRHDRLIAEITMERDQLRSALTSSQVEHATLLDKTRGLGLGGKAKPSDASFAAATKTASLAGVGALGESTVTLSPAGANTTVGSGWKGNSHGASVSGSAAGGVRELEMQRRLRKLQSQYHKLKDSKRLVMERAVFMQSAFTGALGPTAVAPVPKEAADGSQQAPARPSTMVLRQLGLGDEDVAVLVDLLSAPVPPDPFVPASKRKKRRHYTQPKANGNVLDPAGVPTRFGAIRSIDLRDNRITDTGAMVLAGLLAGSAPDDSLGAWLSFIDLRGNHISPAGIRALAEAVRSHQRLQVQHVYVGRAGLVQALGTAPVAREDGSLKRNDAGHHAAVGVIAVLDVTDNDGVSTGDAALGARELRGRVRASRVGAYGGDATLTAKSPGGTLQLAAVAGGRTVRDGMTTPLTATTPGGGGGRARARAALLPDRPSPNQTQALATAVPLEEGSPKPTATAGERGNMVRPGADVSRGSGATFNSLSRRNPKSAVTPVRRSGRGGGSSTDDPVGTLLSLAAGDENDIWSHTDRPGDDATTWAARTRVKDNRDASRVRRSTSSRGLGKSRRGKHGSRRAVTPSPGAPYSSEHDAKASTRRSKSSRGSSRHHKGASQSTGLAGSSTGRPRKMARTKAPPKLPDVELNESQILPRLSLA